MAPLCSGIRRDVASRLPFYFDDWAQGLHKKVPAATLYIFFLQIFPALTFASFLSDRTGGALGAIETILAMGLGGLLFSVFAGQPLVVVGVTGPVALFCAMLYELSDRFSIPFFGWLFWTSAWAAAQHLFLAVVNACDLVERVTDFSGESFGFLIGVIYVYEGVVEFVKVGSASDGGGGGAGGGGGGAHGGGGEGVITPAGAYLSVLLGLGHLWVATTLANARAWKILPKGFRSFLADYGPSLSIVLFTLIPMSPAIYEGEGAGIPRLPVPSSFQPTLPGRPWVVVDEIANTPGWAIAAAFLPAAVLTTLLFFDHNISAMLSQRPEFGLKKPTSYNYDFGLLGVSVLATGVIGCPPNYGLIPQAPLHVRALAKIKEAPKSGGGDGGGDGGGEGGGSGADGDNGGRTEVWVRVVETRVSAFGQSVLILALLSSPLLAALGRIPRGVLAGLFLYLGLAGLVGNGIWARLQYLIMDRASALSVRSPWAYPSRRGGEGRGSGAGRGGAAVGAQAANDVSPAVSKKTVAAFTLLQLVIVGVIFGITLTPAGIVFPVIIVALVPLRLYLLPRLFSEADLAALDPVAAPASPAAAAAAAAATTPASAALDDNRSKGVHHWEEGAAATRKERRKIGGGGVAEVREEEAGPVDVVAGEGGGGGGGDGEATSAGAAAVGSMTPIPLLSHGRSS